MLRDTAGQPTGVSLLNKRIGVSTELLYQAQPGATVACFGPLGKPFRMPAQAVTATLVGGGYGSAPLLPLATALRERGCRVDFVLGAASADRLFGQLDAKRMSSSIAVTTDDGSMGEQDKRPLVSSAFKSIIERREHRGGMWPTSEAGLDAFHHVAISLIHRGLKLRLASRPRIRPDDPQLV